MQHETTATTAAVAAKVARQDGEPQQGLECPRCGSTNTKFCYYNNYNLSQPRHFCKSCRRYWTRGGVLRNVPVGGGCRKPSKKSSSSSSSSSSKKPSDKDRRRSGTSRSALAASDPLLLSNSNLNLSTSQTPIQESEIIYTSLTANPTSMGLGFSELLHVGGGRDIAMPDPTAPAFTYQTVAGGGEVGGGEFNGLHWAAPVVEPSIFDHGFLWNTDFPLYHL